MFQKKGEEESEGEKKRKRKKELLDRLCVIITKANDTKFCNERKRESIRHIKWMLKYRTSQEMVAKEMGANKNGKWHDASARRTYIYYDNIRSIVLVISIGSFQDITIFIISLPLKL